MEISKFHPKNINIFHEIKNPNLKNRTNKWKKLKRHDEFQEKIKIKFKLKFYSEFMIIKIYKNYYYENLFK